MQPIDDLAELFRKFPGIGRRQAKRFVYFLLRSHPDYVRRLVTGINGVRASVRQCVKSFQYFESAGDEVLSPIERDSSRDHSTIMIVEKDVDVESVEKSGSYHGVYFVLGGLIPTLETKSNSFVRINELLERIENEGRELSEIIIGLSANPEGDHTARAIQQKTAQLADRFTIKISTLGRGLSTGTELEYSDPDTLKSALGSRK
ncbi:MAG: toprim domain-containing protein [Candidatus Nomurabacteria bacterium]|nr:toprim domain-containing protein [Candidatus Nomurabacteria bacterium]